MNFPAKFPTRADQLIQRTADVAAARKVLDRFAHEMQCGPDAMIRAQADLADAIYQLLPDVDDLKAYAEELRGDWFGIGRESADMLDQREMVR